MSWWVSLRDHNRKPYCSFGMKPEDFIPQYEGDEICPEPCYPVVEVEPFMEGGTYQLGGSGEADLNITYNYSKFYYETIDDQKGLKWLHDRKANSTIATLKEAIVQLGTQRDDDYWKATKGNAGYALNILLEWAKLYPEAVFRVS